ncbi:MAG: nucleotidyltransferase-like protein [Bacillus sp. (in: firmicutes)]
MEDILRPIYQERASAQTTLGILLIEKKESISDITDSFDYILLIISETDDQPVQVKHYSYNDEKAALYVVSMKKINEWLMLGSNRRATEWLHHGKIIFDRNESVASLKQEIREFPFNGRSLKKGIEFAKLIRRYTDGKAFFDAGHYMDAYNHIIHSLHHLARLDIIEKGFFPEITVWEQVKHMEPQIYKLYEELITSEEPLDKRLELLFLASEFLIYSKTETGIQHLVDVLSTKEEAWSFGELSNHPEVCHYDVDLSVLLEYLIEKGYIVVEDIPTKGPKLFHRRYKRAK